jgi:hypothetical protein
MPRPLLFTPSAVALLAANATALLTAALAGWSLGDLFRLYWFELIALGFLTLAQIHYARRPGALAKSRGYQSIFFVAHYGTFCVMYYAILPSLLGGRWADGPHFWLTVGIPAAALGAAHFAAFRLDFLRVEAPHVSAIQAMLLPYAREVPVHLPLLAVAMFLPEDLPSLKVTLLFAFGKTLADVAVLRLRQSRFIRPET